MFSGKLFYYQGCKWKPKRVDWTRDEKEWIRRIDRLVTELFGPDYFQYEENERKISIVSPGQFSVITYDHDEWEKKLC